MTTDCGFDIFHLFGGKKESIQIPSTAQTEEIQSAIATETKEQIHKTVMEHPKDNIQSTATSATKEDIQITVNRQASNQTSEGNNYNWFLGLFQPGGNQKKLTQQGILTIY